MWPVYRTEDPVSPPTNLLCSYPTSTMSRGGNLTHLRPKGTSLKSPNNQRYAQSNSFFLSAQPSNKRLVCGILGPVSLPKPYSGLSLPQLGQGGQSHPPATQGDPIRARKQPKISPKQQFFSVHLTVKKVPGMRN